MKQVLQKFWQGNRGVAVIEFALVLPLLVLLLGAAVNYGLIISKKIELSNAVNVGLLYAFGNSSVIANVQTEVNNSTNIEIETVVVTQYCQCLDGSKPVCGQTCSDGYKAPSYVAIEATSNVETYPLGPVMTNPYPITANGIIRVS